MNAIYQTALSFGSQNFGAKNYKRMTKIQIYCIIIVAVVGFILGNGVVFFGPQLLGIYSSDQAVVQYGMYRLRIIATFYLACGLMEVMVGGLRGMGCSVLPMIVSLTGACALRVVWIYTFFAMNRTLETLYISYPISWAVTFGAHLVTYIIIRRKKGYQ